MTPDISDRLKPHRDAIDSIDEEIIALLAKRQHKAEEIGAIKTGSDAKVLDPKRELEGRTKRRMRSKEQGIDPLMTEMVFEQIVLMAREKQKDSSCTNVKAWNASLNGASPQKSTKRSPIIDFCHSFVLRYAPFLSTFLPGRSTTERSAGHSLQTGVMGGIGSFSEAAALQFLAQIQCNDYELQYPISSENVLHDLEKGRIDLGIFPIENSTAGLVVESIHAASRHVFKIVDIFDFDVVHCLMALPGVTKAQVTKVMSHPQALKQCKGYLAENFGSAELVEATDTAEGARVLSQSPDERALAVIAPERCAELYGLEVLEKGIQDLDVNFTRFIAACRVGPVCPTV